MKRYQISSPRKTFAIAALAMTSVTMGLSVVAPAAMQPGARDVRMREAPTAMTSASMDVMARPLHIDVIGVREPEFVSAQVRNGPSKRKQDS